MSEIVKLIPLADRVLIEPEPAQTKTASGLIHTGATPPNRGTVVEVGKGKKGEPMSVKPGDTVLYSKHMAVQQTLNGKDYLIIRESEIYGVLKLTK